MIDNFLPNNGISSFFFSFFFCDPKEIIVSNIFISHNSSSDAMIINKDSST